MTEAVLSALSFEALRAGDRVEFARLVDAASGPIYRLALKMLGDSQDAEDVLQNTFLKAFQHLGEFEGRSSLSTWLYRIAANEALMLLRKRHPEVSLADDNMDDGESLAYPAVQLTDWGNLPEEDLLSSEARSNLDRAIQHLPEILRIVFLLRDVEGLSIQETAEALGLSESAVKTRLLRARLRLREDLSSYYGARLGKRSK
jgi:RNA polymerase sigma-70 factor (ECF subfamily)